ncbi:MAG: cupin [Bacillaceae bacterium]|nr:cupin [Bacillaceae bacterium]
MKKDGLVGWHQASVPQLFMVIEGEGWVKGKENRNIPFRQGEMVLWEAGEWHEASTIDGMTAIVVECQELNPQQFLDEIYVRNIED